MAFDTAPTPTPLNLRLSSSLIALSPDVPKLVSFPVRATRPGVVKFNGTQTREKHLAEMIEKTVMEAEKVCEGDSHSDECKVAWDEVEELSRAKADLRLKMKKQDPLEPFCQDNPETKQCCINYD